jgi:hypothetical protein
MSIRQTNKSIGGAILFPFFYFCQFLTCNQRRFAFTTGLNRRFSIRIKQARFFHKKFPSIVSKLSCQTTVPVVATTVPAASDEMQEGNSRGLEKRKVVPRIGPFANTDCFSSRNKYTKERAWASAGAKQRRRVEKVEN